MKLNKKLNNKGFTLIELLAVIVILALIVGIVFPQVLRAMDNSRVSSLHSNAKGVVNWYNNAAVADSLVQNDSEREVPSALKSAIDSATGWTCINISGGGKKLYEVAGLSNADINTGDGDSTTASASVDAVTNNTCSMIRMNNGNLEVVLVAKEGGKFKVSGKVTYAYSNDSSGKTK